MDFQQARRRFWTGNPVIPMNGMGLSEAETAAHRAHALLEPLLDHAGLTGEQLLKRIEGDDYLVGYLFGVTTAVARQMGIGDEVRVQGLATRVMGELCGGGVEAKLKAHERSLTARESQVFGDGRADGIADVCS